MESWLALKLGINLSIACSRVTPREVELGASIAALDGAELEEIWRMLQHVRSGCPCQKLHKPHEPTPAVLASLEATTSVLMRAEAAAQVAQTKQQQLVEVARARKPELEASAATANER